VDLVEHVFDNDIPAPVLTPDVIGYWGCWCGGLWPIRSSPVSGGRSEISPQRPDLLREVKNGSNRRRFHLVLPSK